MGNVAQAVFVARKETKRQRSWHLVSTERTRNKIMSCEAAPDAEGSRIL